MTHTSERIASIGSLRAVSPPTATLPPAAGRRAAARIPHAWAAAKSCRSLRVPSRVQPC